MFRQIARGLLAAAIAFGFASCAIAPSPHLIRISVPDQKMLVFEKGVEIARYDVSTSKFGVGDRPGSYATPLGEMVVKEKIGAGQPSGMKFKSRRPTGEIVRPNMPGRDPIVSRILWLKGLEAQNRRAYDRGIYIHGTAEEWSIGTPASYGCIRMRSRDVIQLFDKIGVGTRVEISNSHFPTALVAGNGESAPAQQFNMQAKPPGTPAPATAPAAAPVQAAAAVPAPTRSNPPKRHPGSPAAPSTGPTPIPASRG
ncbi:MAG: L,D-transpeptidase [Chthoniobacter sp.]|nr:L,D-transpeptidase [Chthoniobacter sp.]